MRLPVVARYLSALMTLAVCAVQWAMPAPAAEPAAQEKRELVGKVLEKPVYRDQIRMDQPLPDELRRLFLLPLTTQYRQEHQDEVTPSPAEIDATSAYVDQKHHERLKGRESELRDKLKTVEAQLKREGLTVQQRVDLMVEKATLEVEIYPPGRQFAESLLNNWKLQRHLYDKFGGGRILWQQAEVEAFDAMRVFLETQEKAGKFEINDPALREAFYEYWTTQDHGSFLVKDTDKVRDQFLNPKWAPRKPK